MCIVALLAAGCAEPVTSDNDGTAEQSVEPVAPGPLPVDPPDLTEQEIRDGWISLFDGTSLYGWEVPAETNWHVEDGCIVADSGERSLLLTPFRFSDFEMRCDFHLAEGGNSGVFLRTADDASNPATDTYELNICDSHPSHGTGSLVARHVAEGVPPVEGHWHTFRILCEGARIQVWLDGSSIVDFTDESDQQRLDGRIGLQMNSGRIAFRNVFLKPVGAEPLFNGQDLTGWSVVPGSAGEFKVVDGMIHVTGGRGFLETDREFASFILQAEVRTNGDALNSGIFFRSMPGTTEAPSNGYEMQIHNGVRNGDRRQPADHGTGGIFKRQSARVVMSNDHQWTAMTLIAQGSRFATWVNGYQVVDWTDQRPPNPNPREGLRVEAGRLSLQAHDPTTDLDFRTFRIAPMPQ
ncbi:MAG: DUF1080 domain-containing protein [Planctomycetaceae bacterium]|nr:DUF1080 domain-containing protein [Planctomycetaceae bacterium]